MEYSVENLIEMARGSRKGSSISNTSSISNWNMPVMTGIDVLRAIRADDTLKITPVLMVTEEAKQKHS